MATILEHSKIFPPPADLAPEFVLPLVFFDMLWYEFGANQTVLLYDFPACSKSYFLDTIVPDLKSSLSLTLSQFLPFAGNIVHPLTPEGKPVLRYESGDSVSLTVCESGVDLSKLTGNDPRDCDEFYAFAPNLPPVTTHAAENTMSCPVLALQVTVFPGQGYSIGFIIHHAVADASTVVCFIKAWALINRTKPSNSNNDLRDRLTQGDCLPFFDRKTVTNINGLDTVYWDHIVKSCFTVEPQPAKFPINKLRATFLLSKDQIQKLKSLVVPAVTTAVSSFTAACALVWVCSARSAGPGGDEVADDEPEYFCFVADCRGRLTPPLPANYLGNCVVPVKTDALEHGQVKGPNGFVIAANAIGRAIKQSVYNNNTSENGILCGAENWNEEYDELVGKRQYGVAGSPRFDFYGAEYGWGRPKKFELLFIDANGSISLNKSRDFEGALEIGLSKTKPQMDAFLKVLTDFLK